VPPRAVRADALATAIMVLGPDGGMRLAERLEVAALLLVRRDNGTYEQRRSPAMNVLLGGR
jgi:thiamine biosynthesis lipoprotein